MRRAQEGLALDEDDIALLVVGKLLDHKRQMDVIEAVALLNQNSDRRYVAVLAGSGPNDALLAERAAELPGWSVRLLALFLTQNCLLCTCQPTYMCIPLSKSPTPLAISGAVFLGRPVILSDKCGSWGPTDDVQVGVNGLVYPVGDVRPTRALRSCGRRG